MYFKFETDDLKPLINDIVTEALRQAEAVRAKASEKLAYTEHEAAELLSMNYNQLRDERYRGLIEASTVVGAGIRYTQKNLLDYLALRPYEPGS